MQLNNFQGIQLAMGVNRALFAILLLLSVSGCIQFNAIDRVVRSGVGAESTYEGIPFGKTMITFNGGPNSIDDESLARLIKDLRIARPWDLDFDDTRITDASAPLIATVKSVEVLRLSGTGFELLSNVVDERAFQAAFLSPSTN